MDPENQQQFKSKLVDLEQENDMLRRDLAVKDVISRISQIEFNTQKPEVVYKSIYDLLKQVVTIDNFYIALEQDKIIQIPFMIDQNDRVDPEMLREDKNPNLRRSLTGYAIKKSTSLILDRDKIRNLQNSKEIEVIGSLPQQWIFSPFRTVKLKGGIVVQTYSADDVVSDSDMSILTYVALNVGHFLSLHESHKQIEEQLVQLKRTQSQLIQSEKMASVGQLAAGVAHEINNPLGYINSNMSSLAEYISDFQQFKTGISELANSESEQSNQSMKEALKQLMEKEDIDFLLSDTHDLIGDCLSGMDKVKKIVRSLRNFSHSGDQERAYSNINQCIKESIVIVLNELKYHCEIETSYGQIPEINCFPNQLNQIFMNLLINAGHAIKDNGKIKISTQCEGDSIVIKFQDNGSGIKEQDLKYLFDPFFTTKPVGQGTGLGLSISYRIIEQHGGTIEVESEVNEGTCFTIYLPIDEK
ncbi:MAG: hypothetical protein KUG78_09705 [Kangiellaceae bacterium]|nr:hypothetical protein [Kangiellaceae bacterium]